MRTGTIVISFIVAVAATLLQGVTTVSAMPDYGYNYSFWGEAEPAPYPYDAKQVIYGSGLGIGPFNEPQDVFADEDRNLYVADTGNNRIVCLDESGRLVRVIDSFRNGDREDSFQRPSGIFADREANLYVADAGHARIVQLKSDGSFVREIGPPRSSLLPNDFQFQPKKIVLDQANRLYVVAQGAYEGMMEFTADGTFRGYVGTNKVKFNPADLLWKRISTREQSRQMELFLPVEFSNLDIDDRGFLYAASSERGTNEALKRFNPAGGDVLRRTGYYPPMGDIAIEPESAFVDIVADADGMYSGLDSQRNRIFTYDRDGNLLYQFGGVGTEDTNFQQPTSLAMLGDHIVVADGKANRLVEFEPTRYGRAIRSAVAAQYAGHEAEAAERWKEVLRLNASADIAYVNIGKALLSNDDNKAAMDYFRHGNNRIYYSEAFKRYRQQLIADHFGTIVASGIGAVAIYFVIRVLRKKKRAAAAYFVDADTYKAPFYTVFHPFNGFWELKYEHKGRVGIALSIVLLMAVMVIVKRQYSGFIVNYNRPSELNSLEEVSFLVIPFMLWCASNWSLTTLMDGEGKFKEIVIATGYALIPLVVLTGIQVGLSNWITLEESPFIYLLQTTAYIWFLWLLFIGTMTIHQYSLGKTVFTMLISLAIMGFLIFIGLLCFSLFQQMYVFIVSLYKELSMRLVGGSV